VLANGGHRVTPLLIERITDAQGKVVYEAPPPPTLGDDTRVLSARNVFIMQSLLQEVTHGGTAARAGQALKRADVYGKTGTTNDAVDAWFAGFQPSVVAVAWMGYDNPRSLGQRESGGGLALPIWIDYMGRVLKGAPEQTMAPPDSVTRIGLNGVEDWIYADLPADMLVLRIDVEEPAWPAAVSEPASAPTF
jgi:penicillin-binding protein 1A